MSGGVEKPSQTPVSPPPGWYNDPSIPGQLRYWDGARWTEHTQPLAVPSQPGPPPSPASAPTSTTAQYYQRKLDGFAIWSLILGIIPVIPVVGSILAVIFGFIGKSHVAKSEGWLRGRLMAIWGIVLGLFSVVGTITITALVVIAAHNAAYQSAYQVGYNSAYQEASQYSHLLSEGPTWCNQGIGNGDYPGLDQHGFYAGCIAGWKDGLNAFGS